MCRLKHKVIVGQVLRSFVILLSRFWTILLILPHPGHCVNDANSRGARTICFGMGRIALTELVLASLT
jgi:hypothetical protein